jgi:selenocysteine lyase/cysteine desulfurase
VTHPDFCNSVLARALGEQGINVWSGHNYAYEVARYLGLDESEGVLRIGSRISTRARKSSTSSQHCGN